MQMLLAELLSAVHDETCAASTVGVEIVVDLTIADSWKTLEYASFELGRIDQNSHCSVEQMMQLMEWKHIH